MPRLDDPNIKLKKTSPFKRKSLRPWDGIENFEPRNNPDHVSLNNNSTAFDASKERIIGEPLVNQKETIGKPLVNAIGKPLVNQKETIGKPLVNQDKKLIVNKETIGKPIGKPLVNPLVNQNRDLMDTAEAVKRLTGNLLKMLIYIVEDCKLRGVFYTSPITNETFRNLLKTDINSVKTTVQRLIKKGLIARQEGKRGNGGFTVYLINESVRNAVTERRKQLQIGEPLVNALVNHWRTERETSPPVVSSSYINTTTTMTPEFQQIDYSPLADIGFGDSHLFQIWREYKNNPEVQLPAEVIQDSINALAFDLKHNNAVKGFKQPPVVVLTSMLKKGKPYSSKTPESYLSPQQEAMAAYTAAKAKQQMKARELEQSLRDIEFEEWKQQLSEEELLSLCPDSEIQASIPAKIRKSMQHMQALKFAQTYFDVEIWPKRKQEVLQKITEKA